MGSFWGVEVNTALDRTEWYADRQAMKGIGGSEIAAVFGLSPFCSAYELYMIKRGEAPPKPDTEPMRWGRVLEDAIAGEYAARTGRTVEKIPDLYQSPEFPFMFSSLDRTIVGEDRGPGVLEVKSLSGFTKLDDGLPEYIWLQVQQYMLVRVWGWADVAMLLGGQNYQCRGVEPDAEAHEMMVDGAREFMRRVELGDPPKPDGLASTGSLLRRMFPQSNERTVIFDSDESISRARQLATLQAEAKQLDAQINGLKHGFEDLLGENEIGVLPGWGKVTWKTVTPKPKPEIDFDLFKDQQPDMYARYVTETARASYRPFHTYPLKNAGQPSEEN